MGLGRFLFGGNDEESAEIGRNWADRVIEQSGDKPYCDNPDVPEISEKLVRGLGEEYSTDADSFYDGFAEKWNEHVEAVGGDTSEDKKPWWALW